MNQVIISEMHSGEEIEVSKLIMDVFGVFIGPGYVPQGVEEFAKYVEAEALRNRQISGDHYALVAREEARIIGFLEMRNNCHLSLLFVHSDYHRKGIARRLLHQGMDAVRKSGVNPGFITVKSSPYAVPAYERMGFITAENEQEENGIRFVPMKKIFQSA
ncbi:MAG TPA: GNAT family N-acetyltransferase [Syntrophomonadaceae bacterium]|nr:GNAT family N-acetyltransferase [Syntrophomonadaceae bacterium]